MQHSKVLQLSVVQGTMLERRVRIRSLVLRTRKFQAPNSKFQINLKHQIQSTKQTRYFRCFVFEICYFEFIWLFVILDLWFPRPEGEVQYQNKGVWWMPWHLEPMKDVINCDMPRGAVSRRYYSGISEWGNSLRWTSEYRALKTEMLTRKWSSKNSKSEYRNSKQIQNSNFQMFKTSRVLVIWILNIEICLGFRI